MAELPEVGHLRVLDPGAGVGSLTAALVSRCAQLAPELKLSVTAVESDPNLEAHLRETLQDCGAAQPGTYESVVEDFIPWAAGEIRAGNEYDFVVMNPPYRKITKGSSEDVAFTKAAVKTTNLYAGFVTLALRLLSDRGTLLAITPRSFANGTYFREFRNEMLDAAALTRIHVFERRNQVFGDSDVLQENVIFALSKGAPAGRVVISSSQGFEDAPSEHVVDYDAVIHPDDRQRFIRITTDVSGLEISREMGNQPCSLGDLGLTVSTGRLVDFRAKEYLRDTLGEGDVPLLYPGHLVPGGCRWPDGAPRKPSALARNRSTEWTLLPAGVYVVVKRFSAKEEPRRVVASLVTPDDLPCAMWAFENHLNVFHVDNQGLDADGASLLCDYLNSDLVDLYVRLFNGHTQINAGDLRSLRYPNIHQLRTLLR